MIVVHLAGASGSGKTTYGKQLAARYPRAMVVEIDDYMQPEYPFVQHMDALGRDSAEYSKQWHEYMRSFFLRDLAKAQVNQKQALIFVGLLDNMGPTGLEFGFELFFECQRVFLSVPLEINLKQFYTRLVQTIVWEDVARGACGVPDSADQIKHVRTVEAQYRARGYRMMDTAAMDVFFRNLLK